MSHQTLYRNDGKVLYETEAENLSKAIEKAVSEQVPLIGIDLENKTVKDIEIPGALMAAANLRNATFENVNMQGANLFGAEAYDFKAKECDMYECTFDMALGRRMQFEDCSIVNASFGETKFDPRSQAGLTKPRTTTLFKDVEMNHRMDIMLRHRGATIENPEFADDCPQYVYATNGTILGGADPKLPFPKVVEALVASQQPLQGIDLGEETLDGLTLDNALMPMASFKDSKLRNISMKNAAMPASDMTGSKWVQVDAENAKMEHSNITKMEIKGGNIAGTGLETGKIVGEPGLGKPNPKPRIVGTKMTKEQETAFADRKISLRAPTIVPTPPKPQETQQVAEENKQQELEVLSQFVEEMIMNGQRPFPKHPHKAGFEIPARKMKQFGERGK